MSELEPRSYRPGALALNESLATMLKEHPEAFDCIIYAAKDSEHNEILANNQPVATLLDTDERAQEYEPPILARAMIAPRQEPFFEATESGLYESFHDTGEGMTLILLVNGLRRHSLVQWKEYLALTGDETVERVVYIADEKPIGKTLNAGMLYLCYPLAALGEKPAEEPGREGSETPEPCPENPPHVGIL